MKKKLFIFLPVFAVTLSGCSFIKKIIFGDDSSSAPIVFPDPIVIDDETHPGVQTIKSFSYNLRDVLHTSNQRPLNSVGNVKLLVVPVELKYSSKKWTNESRQNTYNCFFGDPNSCDLGWESVSSYYAKSSYGKLNVTGELGPTFVSKYTFDELNAFEHPDRRIVEEFQSSTKYDSYLKNYDTDEDGYIDSVAFIYQEKIEVNSSSNSMKWWAFVYANVGARGNVDRPVVNEYMWAAYDFTRKYSSANPHGGKYDNDAHTYIHEFGHLLGLDDYYEYPSNDYDPSGGQEMHSQNIGDENIYSKLCLGWIQPYYVKTRSSVTITLNSAAHYGVGNAIILNDEWNKESPMGEYIAIEYYTPTDLNQKDSESAYARDARMFQTPGFRIYHIDSRLVRYNKTEEAGFVDRVSNLDPNDTSHFYYIGASNTPAYPYSRLINNETEMKEYKLLHMMQAGGVNTFKLGQKATDADLFKLRSSFTATNQFFYRGDSFNNGNEVGYRISIGLCEATKGTLTITKL